MWGPWMAAHFHLQRNDLVANNITLFEIIGMWDGVTKT